MGLSKPSKKPLPPYSENVIFNGFSKKSIDFLNENHQSPKEDRKEIERTPNNDRISIGDGKET